MRYIVLILVLGVVLCTGCIYTSDVVVVKRQDNGKLYKTRSKKVSIGKRHHDGMHYRTKYVRRKYLASDTTNSITRTDTLIERSKSFIFRKGRGDKAKQRTPISKRYYTNGKLRSKSIGLYDIRKEYNEKGKLERIIQLGDGKEVVIKDKTKPN